MARTKARAGSRTAERILDLWAGGHSVESIAHITGLTKSTVVKFLRRAGIDTEERRNTND